MISRSTAIATGAAVEPIKASYTMKHAPIAAGCGPIRIARIM
jgi:hypothetical protein